MRTDGLLRRRVLALSLLLMVAGLAVVARLVQLQAVEHGRWRAAAAATQERIAEIPQRRGTITDRSGIPLAVDVKAVAIAIDGFNMTRPETLIGILSEELGVPVSSLDERVYRESYFTWLDRGVDLTVARRVERRAADAGVHGLIFLDTWKRTYPQGDLASNLIGFVGTDGEGLEGIELAYDDVLTGTAAQVHLVCGADGRTYCAETIVAGSPGRDVRLTIDARFQLICEEEIDRGVARFAANTGFVVLLDPESCDVLAMAQDRRYDLNRFGDSTPEQRRNLAVGFLFEPGSSFKALTGLAALDCGAVDVGDEFDGNDGILVAGHVMHNAEDESFGTVTFAEVIAKSINTGMIRVAQRVGDERLYAFLRALALGERTGIGLPGEERGILRDLDDWSKLALAATSIGQSVGVTGIQLARAIATVANGGLLLVPRIVMAIGADEAGDPEVVRRVAAEESCARMRELMRGVVESGTGALAAVDGYTVAGKTGTAQKAVAGRGYVDGRYTSLFAGLLPADAPAYLGLVVLDEVGTTPVWGGYTAGQIYREALSRIVATDQLPPVAAR